MRPEREITPQTDRQTDRWAQGEDSAIYNHGMFEKGFRLCVSVDLPYPLLLLLLNNPLFRGRTRCRSGRIRMRCNLRA